MDVKNAFLNMNLSEEVYMQPLLGLSIESNKVCHRLPKGEIVTDIVYVIG